MGTPLHIVALSEARELLSVLRRNRRFGYFLAFTAASQPSEHPFVKEIKLLRDIILESNKGFSPSDVADSPEHLISEPSLRRVLEPFLHVITSRDASGLITGVALQSVDRIVSCLFHLINIKHDETLWKVYVPTLNIVVDSIAACRFDVTDPAADEVVLSRITSTISRISTSPGVYYISDASMLRGIEACLGIAMGPRRASELLRRSAEAALCEITSALGNATGQIAATSENQSNAESISKTLSFDISVANTNGAAYNHTFSTEGFDETGPLTGSSISALILVACRMAESPSSTSPEEPVLGLQMLSSLLTFGGKELMRIEPVREVLLRDCSRVILRCVGAFKSPLLVIAASFTTARLLVHTLGQDAIGLLSALLEDVYPCYVSGLENIKATSVLESNRGASQGNTSHNSAKSGNLNGLSSAATSGEIPNGFGVGLDPVVREVGLESLADLLAAPGLLSSLYAVVDCDLKSEDVVAPLLFSLGRASVSCTPRKRSKRLRASSSGSARMASTLSAADSDEDEGSLLGGGNSDGHRFSRSAALLCAEAVLAIVRTIGERLDLQSYPLNPSTAGSSPTYLDECRAMKKEKIQAQAIAMAFNSQPRISRGERLVAFLRELRPESVSAESGTVQEDLDNDIALCVKFLRETKGLNKEMIGAILGEPDDISRRILSGFTATFNFHNRPFTDCLRLFLDSFRLPGEAQKIDRIVESFSRALFSQNEVSDSSEVNGDTDEKSIAGLFKNADGAYTLTFSTVMLNTDMYNDSIKKKMSFAAFVKNNAKMNEGEDFPIWFLEQIFDSIALAEIKMKGESGMEAMTSAHWNASVEDMSARNRRLLDPIDAKGFDEDIFALCWQSAVAAANVTLLEAGDANQAQKALEGFLSVARCATAFRHSRPVDVVLTSLVNATNIREGPLHGAVYRFGTDIKAQMAAVVLSDVARQSGDCLRADGWQALVSYVLRLHALNLLPDDLEEIIGSNGTDLQVQSEPLPKSTLVPTWWPSQTPKKEGTNFDDDDKTKRPSRAKGFIAALFAASMGSDASSEEEVDHSEAGSKPVRVSHTPPSYLKVRSNEQIEAQKLARKCISRCLIEDILVGEAKILRSDALQCLTKAIARAAGKILDASGMYPNPSPDEEPVEVSAEPEDEAERSIDIPSGVGLTIDPRSEHSFLNLEDYAPSSPVEDSSAIIGVSVGIRRDTSSVEIDSDYHGFAVNSSWSAATRERDEKKAREFVVAFCIDLLCNLTLQNRDRLHIPWPALHAVLVRIIAPATRPSALLERAIIALLRVATRFLHRDELHNDVLRTLNLIVRIPNEVASAISCPITAGLYNVVKSHGVHIASTSGWHAIFSIIENMPNSPAVAVDTSLKILTYVLTEKSGLKAVGPETFAPVLEAIMAFVVNGSVKASISALELLSLLSRRIPELANSRLVDAKGEKAANGHEDVLWSEFWGPLLKGFATGARDPRGKVRNEALVGLEKMIAVCGIDVLSAIQWKVALSSVLFPLMRQLFSTRGFLEATIEAERVAQQKLRILSTSAGNGRSRRAIPAVNEEQLLKSVSAACKKTQQRALTLTSKTFLQHHSIIAAGLPSEEFTDLWLGVLEVYRTAYVGSNDDSDDSQVLQSEMDELQEHVPESVKNLMLVMSDCGLLVESDADRWNATFELVRAFLPDNVEDIETLFASLGSGTDVSDGLKTSEESGVSAPKVVVE